MTVTNYLRRLLVFVALFFFLFTASAQFGPRIESPVVNDDSSVTFSISAPNAGEVTLSFLGENHVMEKNTEGVWSVTVESVEPDKYTYAFSVDDLKVLDPANPQMQVGQTPSWSLLTVPANPPNFFELQDVPHGAIHIHKYYSTAQDVNREMYVYTPPGYNPDDEYPILNLRHGGGDNETAWYVVGDAANILDNLLAEGEIVPMIVVMTNGNVVRQTEGGAYGEEGIAIMAEELLDDVLPLVEDEYSVYTGQQYRAIGGLSMGGGQSFYIGLRNVDEFDWIGSFSSGIFGGIPGVEFQPEEEIPGILSNSESFNDELDLFYLSVGEQDPRIEPTANVVEQFRENDLDVVYETFEGAHEWKVWRNSLRNFLQMLFK